MDLRDAKANRRIWYHGVGALCAVRAVALAMKTGGGIGGIEAEASVVAPQLTSRNRKDGRR